jgi:hypothetical protein
LRISGWPFLLFGFPAGQWWGTQAKTKAEKAKGANPRASPSLHQPQTLLLMG